MVYIQIQDDNINLYHIIWNSHYGSTLKNYTTH